MSISEYKKALTEPKKPALELRPVNAASPVKEPVNELEITDDDYEAYKLEWFMGQGMSIYDIVDSIVQYAVDTNQIRALVEDSAKVVMDWENSGFVDGIYDDYGRKRQQPRRRQSLRQYCYVRYDGYRKRFSIKQ